MHVVGLFNHNCLILFFHVIVHTRPWANSLSGIWWSYLSLYDNQCMLISLPLSISLSCFYKFHCHESIWFSPSIYYCHNFPHCSVPYMPTNLIHHMFCFYISLSWVPHVIWLPICTTYCPHISIMAHAYGSVNLGLCCLCISCGSVLCHDSCSWLCCL